jgi:hypothetical protein
VPLAIAPCVVGCVPAYAGNRLRLRLMSFCWAGWVAMYAAVSVAAWVQCRTALKKRPILGWLLDVACAQAARPFSSGQPGRMSYQDFCWFILSEEDKSSDAALEYWFKCVKRPCVCVGWGIMHE